MFFLFFFFSSRRRHTRCLSDWSSDVCSSDLAEALGIDPFELRLRNANRVGDLTANRVRLSDPSTVPVVLAAAERIGHDLKPEFTEMTSEPRSGELLPEHLLASVARNGGAESWWRSTAVAA